MLPLPRPAAVYARKAVQQADLLRQQRRQEQEDLKKKKKFTWNQKVGVVGWRGMHGIRDRS